MTATLQSPSEDTVAHDIEPILERTSNLFGDIKVYPPAVDISEWSSHSWLLVTEKDANAEVPGISETLKAKYVHECYTRPHFINEYHKFGTDDTEFVKVAAEHFEVGIPDRRESPKDFTFDD